MSFPVVKRRIYRERLRLLRPCKPKAETEYNVAYKKWPLRPSSLKTFRVALSAEGKKPIKSTNTSQYCASSGYQDSTLTGSHSNDLASTIYSVAEEPPLLSEEWFENNELAASLNTKTACMHERPQKKHTLKANKKFRSERDKKRTSNLSRAGSFSENLLYLNEEISKNNQTWEQGRSNVHRKEAWGKSGVTGAERTRRSSNDKECGSRTNDRIKMGDLCLALDRLDCWNNPDEVQDVNCSYIDELPSSHSVKQVRSESVISMKPFDHNVERKPANMRTPHVARPGSAKATTSKSRRTPSSPDRKQKNVRTAGKITDSDIKKLYSNLSPEEVLQLQKAYNGLIGTKRDKSKTPSKTTVEDLDTFRETAMRATNYPYLGRTTKDWKTSYNSDFGKRKTVREIFENLNTLYKSEFIDPKPRPGSPIPQLDNVKKETEEHQLTEGEKEKIMQEAAKIMENEYRDTFNLDGKSKLANETTSGTYGAYKSWGIKKPPVPVWSDKTVKSLGSAHWNLPSNKEDQWKLKAEHAQGDDEFWPSGRVKPAFKLHISDPAKEKFGQEAMTITELEGFNNYKTSDKPTKQSDDPFIALYYPDIRTNSNYLSEYMRKFHKLPLPMKRAFV